jgi:hypothetical protein
MVDFQEIQRYNSRRIYIFKNSFKFYKIRGKNK